MLTQAKMIVAIRQWIFMQIQILMNTIKETKLKRRFVSSSDSRRCLVSILHIFLVKNCIVWPLIQQFSWNLLTLTRDELYANDTNSNMNYLSFHFIDVSPLCELQNCNCHCKNEERTRVKYHNRYYTSNISCLHL